MLGLQRFLKFHIDLLGVKFLIVNYVCYYARKANLSDFLSQPQDAYGLEKLATEELCKHYTKDFGIECRIGRFHNIYGPFGTWKGKFFSGNQ